VTFGQELASFCICQSGRPKIKNAVHVDAHVRYVRKGSRWIDQISPVRVELLVVPLLAFNKQSPVNLSTDASPSLPGRIQDSKICIQHSHYSNSELIYVNWYLLQLQSVLPITVMHVWA
jgi:hypothetical protein